MGKYITDERTGLKYELVGDYYLIVGEDEPEELPIGIWGQRHLRYLKKHHRVRYANLLTSGKMNSYLADIDRQEADCKANGRACGYDQAADSQQSNGMGAECKQHPYTGKGNRQFGHHIHIYHRRSLQLLLAETGLFLLSGKRTFSMPPF